MLASDLERKQELKQEMTKTFVKDNYKNVDWEYSIDDAMTMKIYLYEKLGAKFDYNLIKKCIGGIGKQFHIQRNRERLEAIR